MNTDPNASPILKTHTLTLPHPPISNFGYASDQKKKTLLMLSGKANTGPGENERKKKKQRA